MNVLSSIDVFGSPDRAVRSFIVSPVTPCSLVACVPQCHGSEIWWTIPPSTRSGPTRRVTFARTSTSARAVEMTIQPPSSMPRSAASSGSISANIAGWSSSSHGTLRLIAPAVWCSVRRKEVATHG